MSLVEFFRYFLFFLGRDRWQYVVLSVIVFLGNLNETISIFIVGLIVDFFARYHGGDLSHFYGYCALLFAVNGIAAIMRLVGKIYISDIVARSIYRMRVTGVERLMNFSIMWHTQEHSGNKIQQIMKGATALRELSNILSNGIANASAALVGILGIFLFLNTKFLVFFVVFIVIFWYIQDTFNRRISALRKRQNEIQERSMGTYFESMSNITSIKSLGAKGSLSKNIVTQEDAQMQMSFRLNRLINFKWICFQLLTSLSLGIFIYMVGLDVIGGIISVGFIFAYFSYFLKLDNVTKNLTDIIESIIESYVDISRVIPIFREIEEDFFGRLPFPSDWQILDMEDIHMQYRIADVPTRGISGYSPW